MTIQYDHLQFFVDALKPLAHYKAIEERLTSFAKLQPHARRDIAAARKAWCKMGSASDPEAFQVHGRDLVEQLLYGFGWRITAEHSGLGTRSLLLSTPDPAGVKFVITCKQVEKVVDEEDEFGACEMRRREFGFLRADGYLETGGTPRKAATVPASALTPATIDAYPVAFAATADSTAADRPIQTKRAKRDASVPAFDHFAAYHLERFAAYHGGEQGVAVLGFEVAHGDLDGVLQRYRTLHPKLLLAEPREYADGVRVLDVLAYYAGEKGESEADPGTVIRFVERSGAADEGSGHLPLPGLSPVAAEFECGVLPAYCDHWVSNVTSRLGFLQTLEETLGFTPKVDFNAGVVAAGEAQIESTVMGNAPELLASDPHRALVDRGQVFLPTNNALSPVGHVHWYLEELGQGIQHVASRVASLPEYVQRANDYRAITGEGVSFLDIPRTYYGLLERRLLEEGGTREGELLGACAHGLAPEQADEVIAALVRAGLSDAAGAVDLDADDAGVDAALRAHSQAYRAAGGAERAMVRRVVARSRFVNLWRLMRDQLDEARAPRDSLLRASS